MKTVGILIFDDVEVLDFCGPLEVFSVTRLEESKRREEPGPFRVILIAEHADPIRTASSMRVLPDFTLDDCPPLDILLIPGGCGTRPLMKNSRIIDWIRARSAKAEVTASVCTGALLLGAANLLQGRRATTHWAALESLRDLFSGIQVVPDLQVVDEGAIVTSAGISAGIDLALLLVARYCGESIARATARYMEYSYPESTVRRIRRRTLRLETRNWKLS